MSRIAVMIPRDLPAASFVEFVQRAEQHGCDELWVVEDLGFHGGIAQAAVALAATSTVTVGIGILPAAARNVAFAAMELNTLAGSFPGRVIAGVGHGMAGWIRQVGAWPESPLTLLEETMTALQRLLAGERVTVNGRYVRLDDVGLENPAATVPPVLAGVRGPKSMELAGRVSDGVVLAEPVTPEYLTIVKGQLGLDDPTIVAFALAAVDNDPEVARQRARPALAPLGDPDWAPHIAPLAFAEDFRELRASMSADEFAQSMPDEWVDQLAVVGTPDTARERIATLHTAGATCVVLIPLGDPFEALDQFAPIL